MTRHAHLNNVEHRDLRIITARGAQYGDEVMYTLMMPNGWRWMSAKICSPSCIEASGFFARCSRLCASTC